VDPVPEPLLLRKSGSSGNRALDLWICSQELLPLDHRSGQVRSRTQAMEFVCLSLPCTQSRTAWWTMLSAQCYCSSGCCNGRESVDTFLEMSGISSLLGVTWVKCSLEYFFSLFVRKYFLDIEEGISRSTRIMDRRRSAKECGLPYPKHSDDGLRYALLLLLLLLFILLCFVFGLCVAVLLLLILAL
jgi:hypothetical protein